MIDNSLDVNTFRKGPSSPGQSKALKDSVFEMASQPMGILTRRELSSMLIALFMRYCLLFVHLYFSKNFAKPTSIFTIPIFIARGSQLGLQMSLLYASLRKRI